MKNKLGDNLAKVNQRHKRREQVRSVDMNQDDCEKNCASTQFL